MEIIMQDELEEIFDAIASKKEITIFADGSGKGFCGLAFPDIVVRGKVVKFAWNNTCATHNEAEYDAIIHALENVSDGCRVILKTDSQLVVGHLTMGWKINKNELFTRVEKIRAIIRDKNLKVTFEWIPREQNIADGAIRGYMQNRGDD